MDQEARDILITNRIRLFSRAPFFGHLGMNLFLVEDNSIPTLATDGYNIYYNPSFVKNLNKTKDEVIFGIAHEIVHCALYHITRGKHKNHPIWNIAIDHATNLALVEAGFTIIKTIKLYCDKKYENMTSEAIYDDIFKSAKFDPDGVYINSDSSFGSIDIHPGDKDFPKGKNSNEDKTPELEQKWKEAIISAYEATKNSTLNKIPGSLIKIIEELKSPKIKWYEILNNFITEYLKSDYTWMKPNKRFFHSGIIMPSLNDIQKIKISVAIDTSGSISSDDLVSFLSEIYSIISIYDSYEVNIACFDTSVRSVSCLKSEEDFDEYMGMIAGGGGTDFCVWWDWAKENEWLEDSSCVIFFTDGYPGGRWIPDGMDSPEIFWIVKGSTNVAPVGTTLFYND